jgi:hypothetical protein
MQFLAADSPPVVNVGEGNIDEIIEVLAISLESPGSSAVD